MSTSVRVPSAAIARMPISVLPAPHGKTITPWPVAAKARTAAAWLRVRREGLVLDTTASGAPSTRPATIVDGIPDREQAALERAAVRDRHLEVVAGRRDERSELGLAGKPHPDCVAGDVQHEGLRIRAVDQAAQRRGVP